jgi:hypothetical protein
MRRYCIEPSRCLLSKYFGFNCSQVHKHQPNRCQPNNHQHDDDRANETLPHMMKGASALSELHNHRFRISALRAFKSPLVVTVLVGWFDLRKKHWHSAQRASSLSYRRRRIENDGLRHSTLPDWYRRERN